MNGLYNEEQALLSLRSVYPFQSALADFVNSVHTFLEAGFNTIENQIIAETVYRVMKSINELQKFYNQKIEIFTQKYTEAELYALYLEYRPINELQFPKRIMELYNLTKKCFCTNWKRTLIFNEMNQFLLLLNHQKKLFSEFQSYKNNPTSIWLSEKIFRKKFIDENTYSIDDEYYDENWEE